jgi:hypothetical protein
MNIILFFLFSFGISQSFGKSLFLEKCTLAKFKNEESLTNRQIDWLKTLFKTNDCNLILKHLKNTTTFTELIPNKYYGRVNTENRLFKPKELIFSHLVYENFQSGWEIAAKSFKDLSLFQEFSNLKHIYIESVPGERTSICEKTKQVPSLKSIAIDNWDLREAEIQCINENAIKVFIIGNFYPNKNSDKFKHNIVGINNYIGSIADIRSYEKLSYLGMEDYDGASSLKILSEMRNLTSLHLNVINVSRIEEIDSLTNLVNLSLNCYKNHSDKNNLKVSDIKCKTNQITDISFLKNLIWLKGLDLSWNDIKDVSPLSKLNRLEYINLRMNQLIDVSPLSSLIKVKYLDFSGNNVRNIDSLAKLRNLVFLNASNNKINSIESLSYLEELQYLSIGNNSFTDVHYLDSLNKLKVLNLNAEGVFKFNRYPEIKNTIILKSVSEGEEKMWPERILFEDLYKFHSNEIELNPNPSFSKIDFSNFPHLQVLTMTSNLLTQMPDFSNLKSLKYLDISSNNLDSSQIETNLPKSLKYFNN